MAANYDVTIDHIKSFFSMESSLQPLDVVPTVTGGLGIDNREQYPPPEPDFVRKRKGSEYAKKYIEAEEELLQEGNSGLDDVLDAGPVSRFDCMEELSTAIGDIASVNALDAERAQELYATYYKDGIRRNQDLPITSYREKIVQLININQVVIIEGATGCGKTTQVPQYILDYHAETGRPCNIVVTQPRKIAAVSIARRVAYERNWALGTVVGYQVAMDSKTSADTLITYVTTGVLLQKLVNSRRMDMYTHVIIDEVHERDQNTDFALLLVKKLLRTNSKSVKVILMSATIDTSIFAKYFAFPGKGDPAPVIEIYGKSNEVTEHYIQELSALGPIPPFDPASPMIPEASYDLVVQLLFVLDRIEKAEQNVSGEQKFAPVRGAVLIFLPGYDEIGKMKAKLAYAAVSRQYDLLPLHSTITIEEQSQVFRPPRAGHRKIILSTNIAESSITVPDIKYVIDFCLTKNLVCDPDTNYTCLQLEWASKSNCIQRKGRAGRVDIGRVYRMVPRDFYDKYLPDYNVPEIKRCPLTQTVLYLKKLNFGSPKSLLALALDPPELSDIESAILVLKEVGALTVTYQGIICSDDGDLTFVGHVMASLPLDVNISKLIIYGYVFGCLEECIIIAASLSLKSFFRKPFQNFLDSYKSKLSWSSETFSDCLAYLYAYRMWKKMSTQDHFNRPSVSEKGWAQTSFIQLPRIKEVDKLVQELKRRLERLNIRVHYHQQAKEDSADDVLILKIVIAGAFFPNYFVQSEVDEKEVARQASNCDPYTTVVLNGLPMDHGILYYNALREMMSCCSPRMTIEFEDRKAYVQFDRRVFGNATSSDEDITILPSVYYAVKMRQIRRPLELQVFSHEDAERKMQQYRALLEQSASNLKRLRSKRMTVQPAANVMHRVPLPELHQIIVPIFISHIINPGHFWARYIDQKSQNMLRFLENAVNAHGGANLESLRCELNCGMLVLAPYEGNQKLYYRATIEDVSEHEALVFYIDYGNMKRVACSELRYADVETLPDLRNIPALAFECQLKGVKPSAFKSKAGWSTEARNWFHKTVSGQVFNAHVYSVVQNIVRLELHICNEPSGVAGESINVQLIHKGFAEPAEESYMSKMDNETRQRYQDERSSMSPTETSFSSLQFTADSVDCDGVRKTSHKIRLHGPYSPLEVSYVGTRQIDHSKAVKVDEDSVNSVSLDPEPQDKHPQLLVACSVCLSQRGNTLKVRNTTLMPKIMGLQGILCLLFAPSAELRTDPERQAYTGAICGLGCDPRTGVSLFPDHDIEVVFETVIDYQDICSINAIRMCVNMALGRNEELAYCSDANLRSIQGKLKKELLEVVKRVREPKEPRHFRRSYSWKQVPSEHILYPVQDDEDQRQHILPLHNCINLSKHSLRNEMKEHLEELKQKAGRSLQHEEIKCRFCGKKVYNRRALLLHLDTSEHREKVEQFLS